MRIVVDDDLNLLYEYKNSLKVFDPKNLPY